MPVYEFVCTSCGAPAERVLPMADADRPGPCPTCGGPLRRRFSRVAVRYGAWGFAATDGMVPERPGRGAFAEVRERAERLADGDA